MPDIEWKPLPAGLWSTPAAFAEVGVFVLQVYMEDGVPTWEITQNKGKKAEGISVAKGTADSFEAAKAAALFEARVTSAPTVGPSEN
jgi:hypothetical protein